MSSPIQNPDALCFCHEAMNTTFELRLVGMGEAEARGMARECAERIEELERKLSRFREDSDVSRINRMRAGETLYLSEECHECLRQALEAHALTLGLFDVTIGRWIEHRKTGKGDRAQPLAGRLTLHPDVPAITCEEPGREIDLGGIGKGFALDQLKVLLTDWGAPGGLLASGASTLLAFGGDAWRIDLAGDRQSHPFRLQDRALGASGTGIQGAHVVRPCVSTGAEEVLLWSRAWVVAPSAAQADAWSTALLLTGSDELEQFLTRDQVAEALYTEREGVIQCWRG